MKNIYKEFRLSSWAIDHKTVIYVIMALFFFLGIRSYNVMPRESFPEINDTRVFVSAVFPGNTAEDIERLIVDPLEEALKGVQSLVDITSTSEEDFAVVKLEFDEEISVDLAKQRTKDLVDGVVSGADWPTFNNAKVEPSVFEMDFSTTERCEVIAESEEDAVNLMLSGDFSDDASKEWEEIKSQGGDYELISVSDEEELKL